MNVGQISAAWYDHRVRSHIALVASWLDGTFEREENPVPNPMNDIGLAGELHEWLNAPDSLLQTWSNDGEDLVRAQCLINLSQHPDRVMAPIELADAGEIPEYDTLARAQYVAAHVFVRDVLWRMGRTYEMPTDLPILTETN